MGKCISVCKCLLSRWYLIHLWKAQGENSCHQLTGFSLSVSTLQAQEGQEYGWFLKEPYSCSSFWSTEEKMCINTLTNTHMYVCVCRISMFQFLLHKSPCARPQHSIFSLYLIPIFYYPYFILSLLYKWLQFLYLFERSCHAYWYSKDFKISQEKVLQLSRKWCYSPECW